ncbi:RNA polymerase sigma (SigX) subunit [Salsuginibacillus halophilus]|uniref:RNA polymerase sigma factor n=1 Tax=Salsuginibacillus halophilus TaxID=517424 RepID=A0A2P8H8A5_9BACI|nr:RNA polymerase sigma factor SigX [Salsuginibacillus halophilus]PSL42448.1 RNA polymerase sigma (SigX) subunit [Salsuginibacillus halophilus]
MRDEREEFERLYEEYHAALFQFIYHMLKDRSAAEELVQEVYIKVLGSYRTFEGKSKEKTWLFSIARHAVVDWVRKENRKKRKWLGTLSPVHNEEVRDPVALPEEVVLANEDAERVYRLLDGCSEAQRHVLILRYIEGFNVKESAEILEWSESKVKTTQHRAIKKLQKLLEQEEGGGSDGEVDR